MTRLVTLLLLLASCTRADAPRSNEYVALMVSDGGNCVSRITAGWFVPLM